MFHITKCSGFGEQDACGRCIVYMTKENLSLLPRISVIKLFLDFVDIAPNVSTKKSAVFDYCVASCKLRMTYFHKAKTSSSNFEYHRTLIYDALTTWNNISSEINITEDDVERRFDITVIDTYLEVILLASCYDDLREVLEHMNEYGGGQTDTTDSRVVLDAINSMTVKQG